MELSPITVIIPVGPKPIYKKWFSDAFNSAFNQTYKPDEIFILDDQALLETKYPLQDLLIDYLGNDYTTTILLNGKIIYKAPDKPSISIWKSPWLLGVSTIFNIGVALSENNMVMMMGSDDILNKHCLEHVAKAYMKHNIEGWYNVTCEFADGALQDLPNHAAAVTQKLWKDTGGFPPSAAVGAPDALLLSIMLKHMSDRIIQVEKGTPLYWVRQHNEQATNFDAKVFHGECISIRNKETERWSKPEWTC